jgi:hypothetical protein
MKIAGMTNCGLVFSNGQIQKSNLLDIGFRVNGLENIDFVFNIIDILDHTKEVD